MSSSSSVLFLVLTKFSVVLKEVDRLDGDIDWTNDLDGTGMGNSALVGSRNVNFTGTGIVLYFTIVNTELLFLTLFKLHFYILPFTTVGKTVVVNG
jgi:hypothetical protein